MLALNEIKKSFFGAPALRGVSFTLGAGRVLGLVGENGAGKSTLMNIVGGVLAADEGQMKLHGAPYAPQSPAEAARTGIAFVHQELNLFPNLSIAENLFVAGFPRRRVAGVLPVIDRRLMREQTRALLAEVDLAADPNALVERLSPGERQLVEIAKALSLAARVIIFDEPTTSLTARETERLFALIDRLRARGIAMIYISHVLDDVMRLCDEIVVLRDGATVGAGPATEFTRARMITLMVGRELSQLYPPRETGPTGEVALEVAGLTQPGLLDNISFALQRGEVLGIAGLMGAGRTELARATFGLDPIAGGAVRLAGQALNALSPRARIERGLAFLTEDRRAEGLLMDASIRDNVALAALPAYTRAAGLVDDQRLRRDADQLTASLHVKGAAVARQAVRTLSGGNQQKVVLAKWLLRQPKVLLLDEPTRGVDVGARYEIYTLINELARAGVGLLLISSEIEELMGMCDRILVLRRGRLTAEFARSAFDREAILRAALGEEKRQNG